ncbi:hypothetical protein CGCSCA4_v005570 [Colletotrichum siamense]|uniref:Uncharacterized protein n=1 Tax=Colletotrichum siamense TaxID=690259 RepID=A0A9P5EV14_COLSI|nr:hypothetical protein CGCSCA4_v005570 [Colletotrichum siamense]KAF4859985.1 hypothetical protein CGCSCA2_v005618 [Colletotrichum siamense]
MYSRGLLCLLLVVPFTVNAVPVAEQKHNGKPIHVTVPGVGSGLYYPGDHGHSGNVAVWNYRHYGNVNGPKKGGH